MIFINPFSGFNIEAWVGGVTAKISITGTGNNATSPGWTNNLYITHGYLVNLALLDTTGASTGWSINSDMESNTWGNYYTQAFPSTTNFPSDIMGKTWWGSEFIQTTWLLSGLDITKTYDVTMGYPIENGADFIEIHTRVTGASVTTHDYGPTPLPSTSFEDLFSAVVPNTDGTIAIFIRSGLLGTEQEYFWNLGGIIVKEN